MNLWLAANYFSGRQTPGGKYTGYAYLWDSHHKGIVSEPQTYYVKIGLTHSPFDTVGCVACEAGEAVEAMRQSLQNFIERGLSDVG